MRLKQLLVFILLFLYATTAFTQSFNNFKTSVYTRAYEVQKMEDTQWLESTWETISSQMHVDKIYLETHRDLVIVDKKTLQKAIDFFESKGIEVAGGITYTIDESNHFQTFCYQNPEIKAKAQEIIKYTASFFDEIILDDFFFTNCKCEYCIKAKGDRSWTDYRLELMTDAAENVIVKPAKAVNPNCKVIIKYPNWYDHFHELGFNLETEPAIFDGLYTGTETRDAKLSNQHLQPYLGYLVYRYYNNLKPGKNGGGWVDTGGMKFYDRYAEQLWLSILAKAPEMTMFDYHQMLRPLKNEYIPAWSNQEVSLDYDNFLPSLDNETIAKLVEHSLRNIDKIAGKLGKPFGIKSYKPFHSSGEDFLQNYFGMIGIPMDLVPNFPMDDDIIILTEQAKADSNIVKKIQQRLENGKDIVITSGLLNALQDRGIRNIVNLEYTSRKAIIKDFLMNWRTVEGNTEMLIPQIQYYTNDSWEIVSAMDGDLGWPLLQQGNFGTANLYVLTIPENYTDLFNLPEAVLNTIRNTICKNNKITIEGPSKVSLFTYDNNTIVVESFNDNAVDIKIVLSEKSRKIVNLASGKSLNIDVREAKKYWGKVYNTPEKYIVSITLPPHSYKGFKIKY